MLSESSEYDNEIGLFDQMCKEAGLGKLIQAQRQLHKEVVG